MSFLRAFGELAFREVSKSFCKGLGELSTKVSLISYNLICNYRYGQFEVFTISPAQLQPKTIHFYAIVKIQCFCCENLQNALSESQPTPATLLMVVSTRLVLRSWSGTFTTTGTTMQGGSTPWVIFAIPNKTDSRLASM